MFHDGICLNAVPSIRRSSTLLNFRLFGGCSSRCRHFHVVNIQGRAPENEERERKTREETTRARQRYNLTKIIFPDGENFLFFFF